MNKFKGKSGRIIFVVLLLSILIIAIMDLYVPSLPAIAESFQVSSDQVQLTISFYLIGFSFSHVIYGYWSDCWGRRPVLLIGLVIGVLGSLLCMVANGIEVLLAGRLVQGLGFGAASVIDRAILRDIFTGSLLVRVSSYVGIATSVTIGLAPTLGGIVQQLAGWRMNFIIIFIGMLLTTLYVWQHLPETNREPLARKNSFQQIVAHYILPLKDKLFWGFALCAGLAFSGLVTYAAITPFLIQDVLGYSPVQFGMLSILIAITQALSLILNAKMIDKLGIIKALRAGMLVMLLGGSVLLVFTCLQ